MGLLLSRPKAAEKHGRLVPVLLGILLLQGCFYLGLRLGPGYLSPWIQPGKTEPTVARIVNWRSRNYAPERDPAVGMELPSLRLPLLHGSSIKLAGNGRQRTLLLFLPEVSCSARSLLSSWDRITRELPRTRLVGVAVRSGSALQLGCNAEIQGVPIVVDVHAELARTLNASWRPRAYLLDEEGRVQYVQPVTTMDGDAMSEVPRLLRPVP